MTKSDQKDVTQLLFISRAYPPTVGGIENQNYGIAHHLSKRLPTTILANKRGKKFLPIFLLVALCRSLFLLPKHHTVLLGDGVLAPIGALLGILFPKKSIVCIIHGLDITYAQKDSLMGKVYRFINIPSMKLLDKLIMVGNQTIEVAVQAGIPRKKCVFVPNGVSVENVREEHTKEELELLLNMDLTDKKVILRVGRFVEHKGVEWFIRNVVPLLPEDHIFIAAGSVVSRKTAGDQNYLPRCRTAVSELHLEKRVQLLTNIPWKDMKILFNTADVIVSPNIIVPGSMEGFGINAIEGVACQKIVIASDLDGLKDAIKEGKNGYLVEPGNAQAFSNKIRSITSMDPKTRTSMAEQYQKYTLTHYSWDVVAEQYHRIICDITK